MGPIEIAIIAIVGAAFAAIVGFRIYKKVKHKGGGCCDCGCSSCPHCSACEKDKTSHS